MAKVSRWTNTVLNPAADGCASQFNSGYIRIYNGSKPTNVGDALSGQTLLAELRFNATAFGAASGGVLTANAVTPDSSADATGTATWARYLKSDGTTILGDGEVGVGGTFNIQLPSTSIVAGIQVSITSLTVTLPAQG